MIPPKTAGQGDDANTKPLAPIQAKDQQDFSQNLRINLVNKRPKRFSGGWEILPLSLTLERLGPLI